jgi:hypothetical protein
MRFSSFPGFLPSRGPIYLYPISGETARERALERLICKMREKGPFSVRKDVVCGASGLFFGNSQKGLEF